MFSHNKIYLYKRMSFHQWELAQQQLTKSLEEGGCVLINKERKEIKVLKKSGSNFDPGWDPGWKVLTHQKIAKISKQKFEEQELLLSEVNQITTISNYELMSYHEWLEIRNQLIQDLRKKSTLLIKYNATKNKTKIISIPDGVELPKKKSFISLTREAIKAKTKEKFLLSIQDLTCIPLEPVKKRKTDQELLQKIRMFFLSFQLQEECEREYLTSLIVDYLTHLLPNENLRMESIALSKELAAWAQSHESVDMLEEKIFSYLSVYQKLLKKNLNFISWEKRIKALQLCYGFLQEAFMKRFFLLCGANLTPTEIDCVKCNEFLMNKIGLCLLHKSIKLKTKIEIIKNIIKNYTKSINECIERCKKDKVKIARSFGIDSAIKAIEPLGDETHNANMGPLCIRFENGKKLVYKPRSLLAEEVIVGEEGLFAQIRHSQSYQKWQATFIHKKLLSSYIILNKGNYGYCEYIDNVQADNTVTEDEVEECCIKFTFLDAFAQEFGIADLHYDNVIMWHLCPTIVDGEVIMIPKCEHYSTDLFGYPQSGSIPGGPSKKNNIWIEGIPESKVRAIVIDKQEQITAHGGNRTFQTNEGEGSINDQQHIAVIIHEHQSHIALAKQLLATTRHRFVLMATEEIKALLSFYTPTQALNEFYHLMELGMKTWNAKLLVQKQDIEEQYLKDFFNNDTAIFEIDHQGRIYYSDIQIGELS